MRGRGAGRSAFEPWGARTDLGMGGRDIALALRWLDRVAQPSPKRAAGVEAGARLTYMLFCVRGVSPVRGRRGGGVHAGARGAV